MSKIRKIAVSIIIGIIAVFGIYSVSNAEYKVGNYIDISFDTYENSDSIFCMERTAPLNGTIKYKIISNVRIVGTKSTDHTNKTIEDKINAKFAYILSANVSNRSDHVYGAVQNAIWDYETTWVEKIGIQHAGLYAGFINGHEKGANPNLSNQQEKAKNDLINDAEKYAENISKLTDSKNIIDNTNKSNITVKAYSKDGTQYMRVGPFNWTFGGTLNDVSIYDQNSQPIAGKLYSTFSGNTEKWISAGEIESGKDFYISIPVNSGVTKITKVTGKMNVEVKAVNIWFLDSTPTGNYQNLIKVEPSTTTETVDLSFDYDIPMLGNLKVIKVDQNNKKIRLPNVGFKIQNKDTKKWVKETNGTISYVDNKEQAKEFKTDQNGEFTIKNLIVGTYVAYETKNPNYGYEIVEDGKEQTVIVDKTAELVIENKQKYIKLSGYVWVDNVSGKQSTRNDLYKDGTYDSDDMLLDGITVRLKDTSGKVIKEAKTANGGAYQFIDVLVDDLDKYYVEFEYDGLTYTNVVSHIDKDNGSKSAESSTTRENFNKGFSSVVGGETANTGATLDENGKKKNDLTYNLTYDADNGAKSTLVNNGLYPITANTDEIGYSIKAHFTPGQEEIKYINLGLYEREQPDISLEKDLENVRLSINGYNHVYQYDKRLGKPVDPDKNDGDGNVSTFNVGVQYRNNFNKTYSRAIYQSDYDYTIAGGTNKLEVYVTYKLRITNESSSLVTRVNSIVDYYDDRYELYGVGTDLNKNQDVNQNNKITHTDPEDLSNNPYTKVTINLNTNDNNNKIEAGHYTDIYVQFKLKDEAVLNILNNTNNLDNVAEISSYSTFDKEGKDVYAGIDRDSNPGSVEPVNATTYQDDTSSAPDLLLEVKGERELSGKVFLDSTSNELKTGEIRQGDGEYKEGELGISGVEVTLTENTGSGQVYTATTDENGDFYISGYIPGYYTLTYTWGGQTYTLDDEQYTITVQDYKGTIYDETRYKKNLNDKNWYKTTDPQYSDALDNYETRLSIDSETKEITGNTTTKIDKMNSTTPTMGIGIEESADGNTKFGITDLETQSRGDEFIPLDFKIINIDFGIVERARQEIDINKRVSGFKVTLANGQVVADVTIDENGNLTGERDHVTYMGPSETTIPKNGFIKLELDNELIQGATLQVEYTIVVKNNSELDYDTKDYYLYGIPGTEDDIICIKPEGVYDYLDSEMALDTTKDNSNWSVVSREYYNNKYKYPDKETIVESYFNDSKTIVTDEEGNTIVTYTWEKGGSETSNVTFLLEEWATQVTETRTIRDVKLDNKTILHNEDLEKELAPREGDPIKLYASKVLANTDEIDLNNDAEITEVRREKDTGRIITPTSSTSSFVTRGQTVMVTTPTGQDQNYIAIIATTISALVILGAGVVLIRKKILGDK